MVCNNDLMNREEFVTKVGELIKLVRTEYGLTQETMSAILGISRKTLADYEKGKRLPGWPEALAVTVLFADSMVLKDSFGGAADEIAMAIAFENVDVKYPPTMGGRVWWRDIDRKGRYRIQQNVISGHYRLLDATDARLMSSFDLDEVREYMGGLI
ncbi:DNA-binding transcriptional regulator, XRE-family HTH domain [Ruminococcaceae bacterium YRB3002]|nr:DNA-binding transcriptional regulator, XRE-family HTH domain [Ruminococcaceae bacterium YRB3002]